MSSDYATIDSQRVDEILASLGNEQLVSEIINEGLEAMADVYYREILSSLRQKMGSKADTTGNSKYPFTLSSGIEKHPDKLSMIYGVHALTDFRLRFFEGGTKKRWTKGHKIEGYATNPKTGKINYNRLKRSGKPGYRGMVTANHFFSDGITNAEEMAFQALTQSVVQAMKNRGIDVQ